MASVDVAIPNYQYSHFLRSCVESVLSQDIDELRVLIIDNASTDDSLQVARALALEDPRIEVKAHERNLGPHASFNEGIEWARADYFLILCSDDYLLPNALRQAMDLMERHPNVGLTYGRAHGLICGKPSGPTGERFVPTAASEPAEWEITTGIDVLHRFCATSTFPIMGCATLVRTSVQQKAGHYRNTLQHTDDFELCMRIALISDIARTDTTLAVRRFHEMMRSQDMHDNFIVYYRECAAAFATFFAHEGAALPAAQQMHQIARRSLAARAYWSGIALVCRGFLSKGGTLLGYAMQLRPLMAVAPPIPYLLRYGDPYNRMRCLFNEVRLELRQKLAVHLQSRSSKEPV